MRPYQPGDLEACRALWRSLDPRHRELFADPTLGGPDPGLEFDAHLAHPARRGVWVASEGARLLGRFELSIALEGATPFGSDRRVGIDGLRFDR